MGLGKGRKVPQSVKTQRKIDAAVDLAVAEKTKYYHSLLTQQSRRHVAEMGDLKDSLTPSNSPLSGGGISPVTSLIVPNWHTAWKWISTWAFGLIAYVSVAGVPPEVIALVPEASQGKVTAVLALIGFVGRFLNQSRNTPQSPFDKGGSMVDLKEGLNDHPA